MSKDKLVIALTVVGAIAFFLGRMSVSTRDRSADQPASSAAAQPTPKPTAMAPAAPPPTTAQQPTVAGQQPTAAPTPAPAVAEQPARPARAAAKQGGAAADAKAPEGSALAVSAPSKGADPAKVTIVEISDFQCPFCGRVNPTIKQIMDTWPNDVQVVFKHNALSFHKRAKPAAMASMAAHKQGKFWEMHDKLFANQRALEDADLEKYAREIGLDMEQFKADMRDRRLSAQVDNDQKAAVALGQGGTPAFLINGKALSGAQPFDKFKVIIESELREANELVKGGTPLAAVHETRAKANLGDKAKVYWDSLIQGKAAPAAPAAPAAAERKGRAPKVDSTVWKAEVKGHEPVKGKDDALVTIVEWSDFQCPFCTKVNPTLKQVMETYPNDVRIVWKNNALPFHKRAEPAARAALAAHEQGKFWEMHDKLFANQRALEDADLEKYAQELGLDMAKWKADFNSDRLKQLVQDDMDLAAKVNARGTPNFFVNGRNLRGAVPFDSFKSLIDEELAKAKKLVEGGTPRDQLYAAIIKDGKTFEPLDSTAHELTYEGRPFKGPADAEIVIAEFSDFQCPYCGRLAPTMAQLPEDPALKGRVKVVFKQFPLSFHKQARDAAAAALAAHDQGKFWEYHDKVFANMKDLNEENFKKWAEELGLDMAKWEAFRKGEAQKIIDQDMAEARKAGLRGTPSIYINGRKFQSTSGYSPAAFKSVIDKYLTK